MISRRKIISRSLDNLDTIGIENTPEEEDVWYDKEQLFRDHINEVLAKWEQIDDEIWAKVIVFERNRRVAKAYARSSVISINSSKNGFDGVRIGLNGFDNPMRDSETKVIKKSIGEGFKIKMDDVGNIFIKRYGKSNVYIHNTSASTEETVLGSDVLQLANMSLTMGTSAKLFDMRKFTTNINREFSRTFPESKRLERQCLSAISLVKTNNNLINCPLWILIINVVAIDILKNRLHAVSKSLGTSGSEDPYSTIESQVGLIYPTPAASDDSNQSNQSHNYSKINKAKNHRNSYSVGAYMDESPYASKGDYELYNHSLSMFSSTWKKPPQPVQQRKKQDDPYYCGLLARVPNFIKATPEKCVAIKTKKDTKIGRKISSSQQQQQQQLQQQQQQQPQQPQQQQQSQQQPHQHQQQHQLQMQIQQRKHQHQYQQGNHEPQPAEPIPLATFHQQQFLPAQNYYPYKLYSQQYQRLSQSQLSLWDNQSLISANGNNNNNNE